MKRRTTPEESVEDEPRESDAENAESDDGGKPCDVCQEVPDSIIYLSCDHILCLVCIARILVGEIESTDEIDISTVVCSLCKRKTALSKEVQDTLFDFLNQGERDDEGSAGENAPSAAGMAEVSEEEAAEEERSEAALTPSQNVSLATNHAPAPARERSRRPPHSETSALRGRASDAGQGSLFCQLHDGEEFVYYNTRSQKLLCAHCLISERCDERTLSELRPVKRCLPEITQNFLQLRQQAALQGQLVRNRRRDLELRRESCRNNAQAQFKRLELALDAVIELASDLKASCAKEFEARTEAQLGGPADLDAKLREHEEYFDELVRIADELEEQGEEGREEYFAFFFANQARIRTVIAEADEEARSPVAQLAFEESERQVGSCLAEVARLAAKAIGDKVEAKLLALAPSAEAPAAFPKRGSPRHERPAAGRPLHPKNTSIDSQSAKSDNLSAFGQTNPNLYARTGLGRPTVSSRRITYQQPTMPYRAGADPFEPVRPRPATQARLDAEAYSALKRRELETKLRMFDLKETSTGPTESGHFDRFFKAAPPAPDRPHPRPTAEELIERYRPAAASSRWNARR